MSAPCLTQMPHRLGECKGCRQPFETDQPVARVDGGHGVYYVHDAAECLRYAVALEAQWLPVQECRERLGAERFTLRTTSVLEPVTAKSEVAR